MRITTKRSDAGIVLEVEGGLHGGTLSELRRRIGEARQSSEPVAVDLSAVEAMDREAVLFFAAGEGRAIEIAGCPRHVREWIRGEARQHGARRGREPREGGAGTARQRISRPRQRDTERRRSCRGRSFS